MAVKPGEQTVHGGVANCWVRVSLEGHHGISGRGMMENRMEYSKIGEHIDVIQ